MSDELPRTRHRNVRWFHELADDTSDVDGSAVVWLPEPARPVVLPRQRRQEDGYRSLRY